MKQTGITTGTAQVQKTVFLGTARILRKDLEIQGYWLWLDFNSIFQYSFTVCQLNNNNLLEHVKITGFTHCRYDIQAAMRIVEVGMKKSNAKKKKNHSGKE